MKLEFIESKEWMRKDGAGFAFRDVGAMEKLPCAIHGTLVLRNINMKMNKEQWSSGLLTFGTETVTLSRESVEKTSKSAENVNFLISSIYLLKYSSIDRSNLKHFIDGQTVYWISP